MTDTLTKPRSGSEALSQLSDVEPKRDEVWRLVIPLKFPDGAQWRAISLVQFNGGLISQRVTQDLIGPSHQVLKMDADIEGEVDGDEVSVSLFWINTPLSHAEFFCLGSRVDEDRFEGDYEMPCRKPRTCGCGGMQGRFSLQREAS